MPRLFIFVRASLRACVISGALLGRLAPNSLKNRGRKFRSHDAINPCPASDRYIWKACARKRVRASSSGNFTKDFSAKPRRYLSLRQRFVRSCQYRTKNWVHYLVARLTFVEHIRIQPRRSAPGARVIETFSAAHRWASSGLRAQSPQPTRPTRLSRGVFAPRQNRPHGTQPPLLPHWRTDE